MDKKIVLAQLKDRRNTIVNRGKKSDGVIRKLDRQIRRMEKDM